MIVRRPSILIYGHQADPAVLREICAGVEEEGVLYEVSEQREANAAELAYRAAQDSMLGAGIGVSGSRVVLQMRPLPQDKPVFTIEQPSAGQCRALGGNGARAIKKLPFKNISDGCEFV